MPRHESTGDVETLARSRAQSAARAQYRNSYSSLFTREFGSTYDEYLPNNQHRFTGQPEPMYSPNSRVSSWPGPNQNGLFNKPMYITNGHNGSPFSFRPSLDFARPIQPETGRVGTVYTVRSNRGNTGSSSEYFNYQVKDFRGEIKWLARNRYGSSLLKYKIEDGVEEDLELIFEELKSDVVGLMVNYFGNNVIQKLFKVCRPEQINYMLRLLLQNNFQFAQICCDNLGSLAMEKLLQSLSTRDQRSTVISALSGFVLMLSNDQNGHKVVEYCICNFPENIDVLINAIADNCFEIATRKTGCCVLQCYLHIAVGEMMQSLMGQLGCYAVLLSEHPYGNYVVQYLLDKKNPSITNKILGRLAEENCVEVKVD